MRYHFKVHKEGKFHWAQCVELAGCITQAKSKKELEENMFEALNLYLEEPEDSDDLPPFPKKTVSGKDVVKVSVDPEVAFSFMMRHYRIKHGMTQKQAAKELGFDNLNSYQRLERKRCNPRLDTLFKIKLLFPEFSLDQALS